MAGKTCARRALSESGGNNPSFGNSAVCVADIESPFGNPTVYLLVTGWRSTHGVLGPIKCLEHPVSAMLLELASGTRENRVHAK